MQLVQGLLEDASFDMQHYHQESFNSPVAEETVIPLPVDADATIERDEAEGFAVHFLTSDVDGQCLPGQTILQAARAAGVRIPAACENGLCGTCKTRKISGEVDMQHNGGILDEEVEDGYILACCSRPLSAVEVEA